MRKSNTKCKTCGCLIYRKPNELKKYKNSYCSRECQGAIRKSKNFKRVCRECKTIFIYRGYKRNRKYCSHECSNKSRRGVRYTGDKNANKTLSRLTELKNRFKFKSCMIIGCKYKNLYQIHRLILGKDGGEYVVGNMFAICPNHHSEIHAKFIKVKKVSDSRLKIMES